MLKAWQNRDRKLPQFPELVTLDSSFGTLPRLTCFRFIQVGQYLEMVLRGLAVIESGNFNLCIYLSCPLDFRLFEDDDDEEMVVEKIGVAGEKVLKDDLDIIMSM